MSDAMIRFLCPTCDKRLKAPESAVGRSTKCPQCGTNIRVPEPVSEVEEIPEVLPVVTDFGDRPSTAGIGGDKTPSTMKCPSCAEVVQREAKKCRFCGLKLPYGDIEQDERNCLRVRFAGNELGFLFECAEQRLPRWKEVASQGLPAAQNLYAMCLLDGVGVSEDKNEALRWFLQAAEQGHADAQYNLSMSGFFQGRQAVEWCKRSAEQGHAPAQDKLAVMFFHGTGGLTKSVRDFLLWTRRAAQQGYGPAQCTLADVYESGQYVEKDRDQAIHWLQQAVKLGCEGAEDQLERVRNLPPEAWLTWADARPRPAPSPPDLQVLPVDGAVIDTNDVLEVEPAQRASRNTIVILSEFSFGRHFRFIQWGATGWYNLLRSACAGLVIGVVMLIIPTKDADMPKAVWLAAPLFWPVFYMMHLLPVLMIGFIARAILAGSSDSSSDLATVGNMMMLCFCCSSLFLVSLGDPLVCLLNAIFPRAVPVESPPLFSLQPIIFVLDASEVTIAT